jgi:pimeloyl-ACP methyl ester carboxylesterase
LIDWPSCGTLKYNLRGEVINIPQTKNQIEIGGLTIAFERRGKGSPLILLHGFLENSTFWRRQMDDLSDAFDVIAWDTPGCGQSSDPPESFRMPDYADCLAGFIEALGLTRPHVLGLSFGGALALELYRRHPTIPRTLVLVSAYAGWAGSLPMTVVEQRRVQCLRESFLPPQEWARDWIPGLLSESAPPAIVDEVLDLIVDFHPAGHRAMVNAVADADLRDVLPRIDVPTLLLYGEADRRSPLNVAEHLRANIPTSRLVVLAGVGHLCNLENADDFNAQVRTFLRMNQS